VVAAARDLAIDRQGGEGLREHRDELLAVYRDAYSDKVDNPFFHDSRYWDRLEAYALRDGFTLVLGRLGGELIGYALGYRLPAGSAWWRGLRTEIDPKLIAEDGTRTFAVTYMMVRQAYRRRGYAGALHLSPRRSTREASHPPGVARQHTGS
jgi:GNAT superfamily N-acetyltransferase